MDQLVSFHTQPPSPKPFSVANKKTSIHDGRLPDSSEQVVNEPRSHEHILIQGIPLGPRTPDAPGLDTAFLDEIKSPEEHQQAIQTLNPELSSQKLFGIKSWNVGHYGEANYPVILGQIKDDGSFSHRWNGTGLRYLDIPIYLPGQGWKIPPELAQFQEVIAMVVEHENCLNQNWSATCRVYVTVDQGYVEPNTAQRRSGPHGDSYVRQRSADMQCDRLYVCADSCPTPFFPDPCPFDSVDPTDIDEVLKHLVQSTEGKTPTYYPSYTLLQMDPYCIHDVGVNRTDQALFRTFIKISVSERDYGKLGNTDNPRFVYDPARIPRHGVPYDLEALKQSAHRKDRDSFVLIKPGELDFSGALGNTSWAVSRVLTVQRIQPVTAVQAAEGEVLKSVVEGFLVTIYVAQKEEWKVTASHGEQYFLTSEKLFSLYFQDPDEPTRFVPKPIERNAVELTEDVRFYSPWQTLQYAKKGDMLVSLGGNDVYAISKVRFNNEFVVTGAITGSVNQEDWIFYSSLQTETHKHKAYLASIGLKERGENIQVRLFQPTFDASVTIDLSSFEIRTEIPHEVITFDPHQKNTLITTDPLALTNRPEDIEQILAIRLYPLLRKLIAEYGLDIFSGSKEEMCAYYEAKHATLLVEFLIPSSAVYYLVRTEDQSLRVVMSGLTGRDNIIAQLITVKLAGIDPQTAVIVGELAHFNQLVEQDFAKLLATIPAIAQKRNALIVAGCGMETTVSNIIRQHFGSNELTFNSFKGDIVSLTYIQSADPNSQMCGLISLHLNYGEITERITQLFLEQCHCTHVFTGGAGGHIANRNEDKKPDIGTRVTVSKSIDGRGELVDLSSDQAASITENVSSALHVQIPSIFLETYPWLDRMQQQGVTSVDVETFYIMRAIQQYNITADIKVKTDMGYFVSDYVGEKPLREYSNVYKNYSAVLVRFLENI